MAETTVELNIKKSLLKKQSIFTGLTDEENSTLASILVERHFRPEEVIVTEGELVDSVFIIVNGHAEVRQIRILEGKPVVTPLAKLGPGDAIGLNERGFYSISGVRTATVVAISNVVALRLSMAAFHGFTLTNAHVSELMRKLSSQDDVEAEE